MTRDQVEKNFLLLTAELDTLKAELRSTRDLNKHALRDFGLELQKHHDQANLSKPLGQQKTDSAPQDQQTASRPKDSTSFTETKKDSPLVKGRRSLFKKIASITHPDKNIEKGDFEKRHYAEAFERVNVAFLDEDMHEVYSVASSLGIEVPKPTLDDLKNFVATRDKVSKEINKIKTSYPWAWYMADDHVQKKKIFQQYLKTFGT